MRSEESPRVAPASSTPALTRLIDRLGATGRLAAALAIAVASYVMCPDLASWHTRVIFSWDAATIAYLCLAWTIIGFSNTESTRAHALGQDTSGFIIFLFVLGAACCLCLTASLTAQPPAAPQPVPSAQPGATRMSAVSWSRS